MIALGGTSYGAFKLGAASVGTRELKNRAVTNQKLADRSVTAGKLATGAVSSGKVAPGAVNSQALSNGSVTSQKLAAGAVGTQQAQAGAGVSLSYETSQRYQLTPGGSNAIYQSCPASMQAIGGGVLPDDAHVLVNGSGPYDVSSSSWGGKANAWAVWVTDSDTVAHTFVIFAVCETAGAVH